MNGSEILTRPPEVSFGLEKVAPPFPSYVSPGNRLIIEARNSVSGLAFQVHVRLLRPDGSMTHGVDTYTPTADRALNTWGQVLAEGFIIGLVVDAPAGAKPGACYVRVLLVWGTAATPPMAQVVVAGYVVTGSGLTWPEPRYMGPAEGPGQLRLIVGTDPAAGSQISETVPTGARWRLLILRAQLTTDATVQDRLVFLRVYSGAQVVWTSVPVFAQAASQTWAYHWAGGLAARNLAGAQVCQDLLPDGLILPAGFVVDTITSGMTAGDNWGAPSLYVEEWIEP